VALPGVGALSSGVISLLSTATIASLSTLQIQGFAAPNVAALTTAQYVALTSLQFGALTGAQVAAIGSDNAIAIGASDIASLALIGSMSTGSFVSLTSAQLVALTTSQFDAVTGNQFAALSSAQVLAIATDDAIAIGATDIKALQGIAGLGTGSVAVLTSGEIGGLTTGQIVALTTAQYKALTTDQLGALRTGQLGAIQSDDVQALGSALVALPGVGALSSGVMPVLSTSIVASLTTLQIQGFTASNVTAFTTAQYVALTSSQFGALTAPQVAAIPGDGAVAIGAVDIKSLANIAALPTLSFISLATAQISALVPSQLSALTSSQLLALDRTGATSGLFTTSQIATLHEGAGFKSIPQTSLVTLTPLALDLNGDGLHSISTVAGVVFDVDADGQPEQVGWLSTSDAWLALDRNGNGLIDDGSELFGSGTTLPDGSKALDGFAALRVLDSNHDGVIDSNDAGFASLSVWVDRNTDAKTDPGELRSLIQAGIQSLALAAKPTAIIDHGNLIGLMGTYTTTDGRTQELGDIWLSANTLGARVVDLSALDHSPSASGSLARITFSGNQAGDTLRVSLNDVLAFGEADIAGGLGVGTAGQSTVNSPHSRQMWVSGDSQDTVQLADAAGWTMAGMTVIGDASYRVLTQGLAQLLVEDKVKIVAV
jgi:hypothetical protein